MFTVGRLEVWPGFVTSISQYEHSIMLMADISHKILRSNTVLDVMYEMYNTGMRDFHGECSKKLIGEIVLTRCVSVVSFRVSYQPVSRT